MNNYFIEKNVISNSPEASVMVGRRLHTLRVRRGFSLRSLAEASSLNVNTLSLIENGKSSPSVNTLQQLAAALKVPISAFFESRPVERKVVFTSASKRPLSSLGKLQVQNLFNGMSGNAIQPFIVTVIPGKGSNSQQSVHTGFEFVFCLQGCIHYQIADEEYTLFPGDSLVFESHLPHGWENKTGQPGKILLVMCPSDTREDPGGRHFSPKLFIKELNMKIAVITEDGKLISQHFGRAPYYLILTIEDGKVVEREMREKMGHSHFANQEHVEESSSGGHGMDSGSHNKHINMAETIADCKALLCGGMGRGAYDSMRSLNIQPLVTDLREIDQAVQSFIDGKLIDHTELLH